MKALDCEWYTPSYLPDAARAVMGGIDLDPASTTSANASVGATTIYTSEEDGLSRLWRGRVWLYPPHTQPIIGLFAAKLVEEVANGNVSEAIVLVNNATETRWWQTFARASSAICLVRRRVKFWHPSGKTATPTQGQVVLYFGPNVAAFRDAFASIGAVGVVPGSRDGCRCHPTPGRLLADATQPVREVPA